MKTIGIVILLIVLVTLALALWFRLAPSREEEWHVDVAAPGFRPGPNWAVFCPAPGGRWSATGEPDLERLRQITMDWPRTELAFGGPETELMTFITRSRIMGFPDYTTVGIRDGQLCMIARQRFGREDMGVNAARLRAWSKAYLGTEEAPDLGWPET